MSEFAVGDKVVTVGKIDGVPLDSVPIGSKGVVVSIGENSYGGGFFVNLYDQEFKEVMGYFCEGYSLVLENDHGPV